MIAASPSSVDGIADRRCAVPTASFFAAASILRQASCAASGIIGCAGSDPSCWSGRRARRRGRISCAGGSKQPPAIANPLDTWSREVIGAVAETFGARAVSPSDRPYLPFQQWAMRAEGLRPSPLGILMHPQYGLWHAYRGALLFEDEIAFERLAAELHLCDAVSTENLA